MVSLVGCGSRVLRLGIQHLSDGNQMVIGLAVRHADVANAFVLLLFVRKVLHQPTEVALADRAHWHLFGDHGWPPEFLAAKTLTGQPLA